MARRIIYLVRHGQYEATTVPPDEPDGSLTDAGREQAQLTGNRLKTFPIKTIHYSPLQRTQETMEILAGQFPNASLQSSALLKECIPSVPEAFKQHFAHLPEDFVKAGKLQAQQAFEAFFRPPHESESDRHELIVAHGNLISHFVCQTLQAPLDAWVNIDIHHCGTSELFISATGFMKLIHHNEIRHLPHHLHTFD
jgi:broad specificity phosphatase PhoE